ncbi:hypothetical protein ABEB36_000110 [Hypothenemus hampei]|uniref:Regulatory protein zeste n=1 Tax=Hypothenemus hampei TaxID=57062 RepID=A0ABD1FDF4_HYPHA
MKGKKHILFGSFAGNKLTAVEKEQSWKEIHEYAQSLGLIKQDKKWTYTRDNLFGLWESRALAKRDNTRKTGTGGGKDLKINEVDSSIFDIIDSESPVLDGIDIPESSGIMDAQDFASLSNIISASKSPTPNTAKKRKETLPKNDKSDNIKKLKEELISIEIYKNKLEVLKLERELNLPMSVFTKDLEVNSTIKQNIFNCDIYNIESEND